MTPVELAKKLKDPKYRIEESGFYWIVTKTKDERGKDHSKFEPFIPFAHQRTLNETIHVKKFRRILIPKARRMGFSTVINLNQLDFCLNNKDFHSRIVDQSESDAKDKLVNRCKKAWEQLDKIGDTRLNLIVDSEKELKWDNGSRLTASISGRGSEAAHLLHVSELGPIDFKDSKRAEEIIDGALQAADAGIQVIESTAKGPIGHFKRLCDNAMEIPMEDRTQDDWIVMFFAWHDDPRHSLIGKESRIGLKVAKYLADMEEVLGRKFTLGQKIWYQVKSDSVANMKYEYPTILSECWEAPIEGAIYAKDINEAREEGRVGKFPYIRGVPVWTIWDLGAPQNTRCIWFQELQGEIRFIKAMMGGITEEDTEDGPRSPDDWAEILLGTRMTYGGHLLPHDAKRKQYHGKSYIKMLNEAGMANCKAMQPAESNDPWMRIRNTWQAFNRFVFNTDDPGIATMLNHLSRYHTKTESDGITFQKIPVHDWSSHYADAFSSVVEAIDSKLTGGHIGPGQQKGKRAPLKNRSYNPY